MTVAGEAPRIGVIGADVPRQLVLAAGAVPVRLFGAWQGEVSDAATDLLGATDAVSARLLDGILTGRHDRLAGLVVCNDSAADLRLFYVLRVLAERGGLAFPVQLLDAPPGAGPARERFVARQYLRLAEFCQKITGATIDADSLARAAALETRLGESLERMRIRRRSRELPGSAALNAYRTAATVSPDVAAEVIDGASGAVAPDAVPLFVTGSTHPDAALYEVIEAAGFVVVGEDHDAGDAMWVGVAGVAAGEDGPAGAYADLAHRHAARPPLSARSGAGQRAAELDRRVVETDAAAVLALVREQDDAPAWDAAVQREVLAARGIPFEIRLRIPPDGAVAATRAALAALERSVVRA